MRARLVGTAFVLGAVVVGAAVAGLNRNWSTHANGSMEVPARDTRGQAQLILHLSDDETSFDYKLVASNITNVTQAHIHMAPPGTNGPIVAWLFPGTTPPAGPAGQGRTDGVLAEGTFTAATLTGPLAGQPLSALVDALNGGSAYVNVHTNDGVAPPDTGAGDFPGGEVRGDIR